MLASFGEFLVESLVDNLVRFGVDLSNLWLDLELLGAHDDLLLSHSSLRVFNQLLLAPFELLGALIDLGLKWLQVLLLLLVFLNVPINVSRWTVCHSSDILFR